MLPMYCELDVGSSPTAATFSSDDDISTQHVPSTPGDRARKRAGDNFLTPSTKKSRTAPTASSQNALNSLQELAHWIEDGRLALDAANDEIVELKKALCAANGKIGELETQTSLLRSQLGLAKDDGATLKSQIKKWRDEMGGALGISEVCGLEDQLPLDDTSTTQSYESYLFASMKQKITFEVFGQIEAAAKAAGDIRGTTLKWDDLTRLLSNHWINDSVLNEFGELLVKRVKAHVKFFNSFTATQLFNGKVSNKKLPNIDLTRDIVIFPIHECLQKKGEKGQPNHWTLGVIYCSEKVCVRYDSLSYDGFSNFQTVCHNLLTCRGESHENWKCINRVTQVQKTDYDCGPFIMAEMLRIALGIPEDNQYTQADMGAFRSNIAHLFFCRARNLLHPLL